MYLVLVHRFGPPWSLGKTRQPPAIQWHLGKNFDMTCFNFWHIHVWTFFFRNQSFVRDMIFVTALLQGWDFFQFWHQYATISIITNSVCSMIITRFLHILDHMRFSLQWLKVRTMEGDPKQDGGTLSFLAGSSPFSSPKTGSPFVLETPRGIFVLLLAAGSTVPSSKRDLLGTHRAFARALLQSGTLER